MIDSIVGDDLGAILSFDAAAGTVIYNANALLVVPGAVDTFTIRVSDGKGGIGDIGVTFNIL